MTEWIVSSSALIALVALLRRLLRGRISLRLQYALWLLVLVRLLVPGTVGESPISVQRPLEQVETRIAQTPLPGNWAVVVMPGDGEAAVFPQGGGEVPDQPGPSAPVEREPSTLGTMLQPMGALLRALWHAGMAVAGLLLVVSNLAFYRRLRRTRRLLAAETSIKVYMTEAIQSPCLFGLPIPAVYVPAAVAEDGEALGHVLAHETAHRRHGDHLWTALRGLCLVLHWYNPLVWWAAALSRRDGELACDEAAVKSLGEEQRAAYGRTLVGLAERRSSLMRCATSMSGSDLKERVDALVAKPTTRWAAAGVLAVAVVVLMICAFTGARESDPNWSTPEEFATWVETGSAGTAVAQMRSTYADGRDYAAETVGVTWVAENITNRFADYDWTEVSAADAAEGLCLEVTVQDNTLRLYSNDVAELEGDSGMAWYQAAYRYGPDVISDSIFSVCREQYDQLVMGSLTDLTLPGTAEGEAADALQTLWNTWLARAEQRLPPGSRWGIADYRLDGTVTEMTTAGDGGDVRAAWEMDVLLQPEDYESTVWWIGNAVGAEVDHGADYAGWIELGYRGWLIRDRESGRWSIPDFGTGGYSLERLLEEYPLSATVSGTMYTSPEEMEAYIPTGAEVTGYGIRGVDGWATFTWEGTAYTLLAREGYPSGEWLDLLTDWKGLNPENVEYSSYGFGGGGIYVSNLDTTAASWKRENVVYVLEGEGYVAEEMVELLASLPVPVLAAEVYAYEKEGFGGNFTIAIYPDGTFQYNEGLLSSHMGLGTWAVEGDTLTLREDEESGYGFVNHFTVTPEGLVFQAEGSDNFLYVEVADGDLFRGPVHGAEEGAAAEPGWTSYHQEFSHGGYAMELWGYTRIVYPAFSHLATPPFLPTEGEFQPVSGAQLTDAGAWERLEEYGDCALYRGEDAVVAMWTEEGLGWALTMERTDEGAVEALTEVVASCLA